MMEDHGTPIRILGIVGSLRRDSYNRRLLRAAAELSPQGVDVMAWDGLKAIPPFDEDDETAPGRAVLELRQAIAEADALLVVTPEYNGSLPGQLKNALDWASRPRTETVLRDRPAAVIGASPSPSGARSARADARRVLTRAGARVVDRELGVAAASQRLGPAGELADEDLRAGLAEVLAEVAREARSPSLAAA